MGLFRKKSYDEKEKTKTNHGEAIAPSDEETSDLKIEATHEEFFPLSYNEINKAANSILNKNKTVVNFTRSNLQEKIRMLDFLCGVAYSSNFVVAKVQDHIYEFSQK